MSHHRLEQHYYKLLAHFPAKMAFTTLQELADILYCSKRHMRNILINMQNLGWLKWNAEPGRGRRAKLQLLRDQEQLLTEKAEKLLEKGKFNQVVKLFSDRKQLITPLLRSKLGFSVRTKQNVLRVPYYRAMPNLCPGTALRRSELHLIRQIFNGLTRINEEKGEVESDLAHYWQIIDPLTWRFFIRPAVLFHDGSELCATDIIESLMRAAQLPLFSHIKRVTEAEQLSIIIHLTEPDSRLALLLASPEAMILPANQQLTDAFCSRPIGTGPYQVTANDQWHLRLSAFDQYFGFRGLLDEIEVLMWHELASPQSMPSQQEVSYPRNKMSNATDTWLSSSLSDSDYAAGVAASLTGSPSDQSKDTFLEQGCYFLLCDSQSHALATQEKRRWLQQTLNPYAIAQQLHESIRHFWVPATSLLPGWCHSKVACAAHYPFAERQKEADLPVLRLAYYEQHQEFAMLAGIIKNILLAEHIQLDIIELDYESWSAGDAKVDIWLGTINFAVPEPWHIGVWLFSTPLLRRSIAGQDLSLLAEWQQSWREQRLDSAELTWKIVNSGWLQPLFHHWLHLKGPAQARGIQLNNLGWFDFKSTWLAPS